MFHPLLLDVAEGGLSPDLGWVFIFIILLTMLLEGIVMTMLRYNSFVTSFWQAIAANAGSLALGFVLDRFMHEQMNILSITNLLLLFVLTVLSEGLILWLLNRSKPLSRTVMVSFLMNVASYAGLFLYFKFIA